MSRLDLTDSVRLHSISTGRTRSLAVVHVFFLPVDLTGRIVLIAGVFMDWLWDSANTNF